MSDTVESLRAERDAALAAQGALREALEYLESKIDIAGYPHSQSKDGIGTDCGCEECEAAAGPIEAMKRAKRVLSTPAPAAEAFVNRIAAKVWREAAELECRDCAGGIPVRKVDHRWLHRGSVGAYTVACEAGNILHRAATLERPIEREPVPCESCFGTGEIGDHVREPCPKCAGREGGGA